MYTTTIFCVLFTTIFARPQENPQVNQQPQIDQNQYTNQSTKNATIINKTEQINEDGSFNFSFETSDGVKVQQNGFLKKSENLSNSEEGDGLIQVLMGGYSYTAPNGEVIQVQYIADENGYQPQGNHIPTPPPIPESIARSLEQINNSPQQYDQNSPVNPQDHTRQNARSLDQNISEEIEEQTVSSREENEESTEKIIDE